MSTASRDPNFVPVIQGVSSVDQDTPTNIGVNPITLAILTETSAVSAYSINDIDNASDPQYFGFTDPDGAWFIMKRTVSSNAFRYVKGTSGYTTAWTNRASQSYDYYNATF